LIAGPVSFLYAGLLGILLVALSVRVSRARRRYGVDLGPGQEPRLQQSIRAQANFAEFVPFAALLLVIAEIQGLPAAALHAAGIVLVASRVLHAVGLARSPGASFGRLSGAAGTWLVILALSLWLLWAATGASRSPAAG
jgi:uncharacterized membrane protein YecN with MAPEG domain